MDIEKKRNFLINAAYWSLVIVAGYLVCAYLIPVAAPFIVGVLVARLVVEISRRVRCPRKWMRILLTLLIYGLVGLSVGLLAVQAAAFLSRIVAWLPELYRLKLLPFGQQCAQWIEMRTEGLDPTMLKALAFVSDSVGAALKGLFSGLSAWAVNQVSGIAKGVPRFILGLLAMIFSTVFVSNDYEHLRGFAIDHMSDKLKSFLKSLKSYLTGTLFVVARSYLLIMLLTFTELSVLFSVFGIEDAIVKASLIALMDILPILGTGSILIPWAVTSLVLGYTGLGIELFVIYGIVTVVRNYAEPKIVGTQLGLHPIISLVSMFLGLRLFGFWGMLGLPIGISYFWKMYKEKSSDSD